MVQQRARRHRLVLPRKPVFIFRLCLLWTPPPATMAHRKRRKGALTVVPNKPIKGEATLVPELSPVKTRVSARNKSLGSLPLPTCRKRKHTQPVPTAKRQEKGKPSGPRTSDVATV